MTDLSERGFAVVTFDWRGQGGSHRLLKDRQRGYVRSFDDYSDDLDLILNQIALPDCPHPSTFSAIPQVRSWHFLR